MSIPRTKKVIEEFERQTKNLVKLGYPKAARLTKAVFLKQLDQLKNKLNKTKWIETDLENGKVPFVIVIKKELVSSEVAMSLVSWQSKKGITKLHPQEAKDFIPNEKYKLPKTAIYLLTDIDRGDAYRNLTPSIAEKKIQRKQRSPLTID